jgi:hypothetical protein
MEPKNNSGYELNVNGKDRERISHIILQNTNLSSARSNRDKSANLI